MRVRLATFHLGHLSKQMRLLGLDPHLVERAWRFDPAAVRRVTGLLDDLEVDVLHTHGYLADVVGTRAARRARRPAAVVATAHGLPEPFRGLAALKMRLNLWLDARALRRGTDHIVAVSREVRERLLGLDVPAERISLLSSAVAPVEMDAESRRLVREEWGAGEGELVVGFVGRLESVKRVHLLPDVAGALAAAGVPFVFVVCGEGPQRGRLEACIARAGLGASFRLLGHRADIERQLQGMDFLVIVSKSEGVPMSLLEAMSAGVVPACLPVGGLPEAIDDGVDGAVAADPAALGRMIAELHAEPELCRRMARAGRQKVRERFSADALARELSAVYRLAVDHRRG